MLVIRNAQLDMLGAKSTEHFESKMFVYVAKDFPGEFAHMGEPGVRQLIAKTTDFGRAYRIDSEGAVAVLLQLTLMFGHGFERSPDAAWALSFIANVDVPDTLRMDMIRDRLSARTQGRSIVRHTPTG